MGDDQKKHKPQYNFSPHFGYDFLKEIVKLFSINVIKPAQIKKVNTRKTEEKEEEEEDREEGRDVEAVKW